MKEKKKVSLPLLIFGAMVLGSRMASGRADIADSYGL